MILHRIRPGRHDRALRAAAPYIRMYKGKIFVVKAGGAVFGDAAMTRALIEQIAILHYLGVRVVMVHGGGPQLTEVTEALGVPTRMVQGRRITDEKSIDATSMVLNGLINTRILAICRELQIDAVGLSGVDASLVRAHRRPPVKLAPGRHRDRRLRLRRRHRSHRHQRHPQAPRQRPDAGHQPAVGRCERAAAQHQCRHRRGRDRRGAAGREADPVHRRARDPRRHQRPGSVISYTDLAGLKRLRASRQDQRRHAAQGAGDRRCDQRRRAPRARDRLRSPDASSPRCSPTRAPAR
jgi:hypothetical protein